MTRTDLIVIIETGQFAQDSDDIIKYVDPSFTIIVFFTMWPEGDVRYL